MKAEDRYRVIKYGGYWVVELTTFNTHQKKFRVADYDDPKEAYRLAHEARLEMVADHERRNAEEQVKDTIKLDEYFTDYLGVELIKVSDYELAGICPFNPVDNYHSLRISNNRRFECFDCNCKGGIVDAVMVAEGFNGFSEATKWIMNNYSEKENKIIAERSKHALLPEVNF